MSSVQDRPYAGTWKLNNRQIVKYTPDALVFVNGDTSLPGCPRCRGRIDIQRFVTSMNVEAGTQIGGHSASIQLNLPRVQGEQVFIDGHNILRPGLEVHIFFRGYFPVRGMFSHLPNPQTVADGTISTNPTGADQMDMSKYATYPYYPAFHGVVTRVSYDYSDGFYTGTLSCASLLHFWSFANVITSGAQLAQADKATNDPGKTLFGHNFNNMHPHSIIYSLYREVAAAGGIEFALSEQSNSSAVDEGGVPLSQQMTRYWEQRFQTRVQSLRMYGVNGNMFNAAQQAWLGSASSRDVRRLLPSPTHNDSEAKIPSGKGVFGGRYSAAKAIGLQGAGADFVFSPLLQEDGDAVNFSVLNLFAFTQSKTTVGSTNLYQTTYQTKADIATQVTKVTGFEFYQDVDGDLVFKPPFFNLDTSTNRYYRLEDQDIINITFTEKEPVATHIIVRGQWIEGFSDMTSNTGVMNLRGHYVDYKLVAQFGWRSAATVEVTTYSDPKVLFFIGVGRLDLLNVATFSANVTIPIRAELRPGYPVYIPFCDCFYYITQLSHQFAFGGRCTTTLVLNCRRAKWHAPGFLEAAPEGESAIKLIRLDRPDLPPRPLEIYDNGIPRIVGFPNVVMALDVRQFNPAFSAVGAGLDYFASLASGDTSADLLFSLIRRDIKNLNAFEALSDETYPDGTFKPADPAEATRFGLRFGKDPGDIIQFTVLDLVSAFNDYQGVTASLRGLEKKQDALQKQVGNQIGQENGFTFEKGGGFGGRGSTLNKLGRTEQDIIDERQKVSQYVGEKGTGGNLLSLIFDALQPKGNRASRGKVDGIPESDVTTSWFEQLTHLKSQFMASSVPGYYRYYSCAHPVEEMQGQPIIQWSDGKREKGRTTPTVRASVQGNPPVERTNFTAPGGEIPSLDGVLARSREEADALQARLDALGVTFTTATGPGSLLRERNQGARDGRAKKQITAKEAKNTPLTNDIADALANIAQAAQILIGRLNARPDFQSTGATVVQSSAWRVGLVGVEPPDQLSQHSQGTALDLGITGSNIEKTLPDFTPVDQMSPALQTAYQALREEGMNMRVAGEITGFGFYEQRGGKNTGTRKPFIHIDIRNPNTTGNGPPPPGERNSSSWFGGQVCNEKATNNKAKNNSQFVIPGTNPPMTVSECVKEAKARKKELRDGRSYKRRKSQPLQPPGSKTPPRPARPPRTPPPPPPEPKEPPSIKLKTVQADVPRLVVQFKPTVSSPAADLRPPEAELGVGPCVRGIQLATGNRAGRGTPPAVTTDLIQTVSFTKHEAQKFATIVGISQTTGRLTFNSVSIAKAVEEKFNQAAQDLSDENQTVRETWEAVYDQIKLDFESVEIPFYDNGDLVLGEMLELPDFTDAVTISASTIPASLLPFIQEQFLPLEEYPIADLSFKELAQFPGFRPQGAQKNDGRSWQRAVTGAASAYGALIADEVEVFFYLSQDSALFPTTGKTDRLGQIQTAFVEMGSKGIGAESTVDMIVESKFVEKEGKQGEVKKPIFSPVFPVSDDRGYEHYGAYRYGRGLSVEPGGTFQFLNSGTDPFRNVTAETAEIFLRFLTLRKQGKLGVGRPVLEGTQEAFAAFEQEEIERRQSVFGDEGGTVSLRKEERERGATAFADLSAIGAGLKADPGGGQDTLRDLLTASGDDPNLITQDSFDLSDTQFARNFANFAVNYGKSDVFKTTVANAAFRLADLTSHLVARAGDMCVCRGSYSDVMLSAYARRNFVAVSGIDQQQQPAVAFQSEQIIKGSEQHFLQEGRVRGKILEGAQPDAKVFENAGGNNAVVGAGAIPVTGLGDDDGEAAQIVGPENPSTTEDLQEILGGEPEEAQQILPGEPEEAQQVLPGPIEELIPGDETQQIEEAIEGEPQEIVQLTEEQFEEVFGAGGIQGGNLTPEQQQALQDFPQQPRGRIDDV